MRPTKRRRIKEPGGGAGIIRHLEPPNETLEDRCVRVNAFRESFLSISNCRKCRGLDPTTGLAGVSLDREEAVEVMRSYDFAPSSESPFWWDDVSEESYGPRRQTLSDDFRQLSMKALKQLYLTFCSSQLDRSLEKDDIVDELVELFVSEVTAVHRRQEETRALTNIDFVNLFFDFRFRDGVITVPHDVVQSILSFCVYGRRLLYSVGFLNWNWYCAVLSSWRTVQLTRDNVFEVPVTVLRSVREVFVANRQTKAVGVAAGRPVGESDSKHILDNLRRCVHLAVARQETNFIDVLGECRNQPHLQTIRRVTLGAPRTGVFAGGLKRQSCGSHPSLKISLPASVVSIHLGNDIFTGDAVRKITEWTRIVDLELLFNSWATLPAISSGANLRSLTIVGLARGNRIAAFLSPLLPRLQQIVVIPSRPEAYSSVHRQITYTMMDLSTASDLHTFHFFPAESSQHNVFVGLSPQNNPVLRDCWISSFLQGLLPPGIAFPALQVLCLRHPIVPHWYQDANAPPLTIRAAIDLYNVHVSRPIGPLRMFYLEVESQRLVVMNGEVILYSTNRTVDGEGRNLISVFLQGSPLVEHQSMGCLTFEEEAISFREHSWFPSHLRGWRELGELVGSSLGKVICRGKCFDEKMTDKECFSFIRKYTVDTTLFVQETCVVSLNEL